MKPIRYFVAVLLLAFSGQSLALFMPAGTLIITDIVVASNEETC